MAISSAELSAQELADAAADKTLLAAKNAAILGAGWRWVEGEGVIGDTDRTDPDYPAARAIDGFAHLLTQPTMVASSSDSFSLVGRIDTAAEFDLAVIHHTLADPSGVLAAHLDIASAADFSDALRIQTWTDPLDGSVFTAENRRLVALVLKHTGTVARRYTGAAYFRLYLPGVGTDFVAAPAVAEVRLLRRRQLRFRPNVPFDEDARESAVSDVLTKSGIRQRYVRHKGRRVFAANWSPDASGSPNDVASIRALYKTDSDHGTQPVVWLDKPTSDPNAALVGHIEASLSMPLDAAENREVTLRFTESAPLYVNEE